MFKYLIFSLLIFISLNIQAQIMVMSYNVENLFDTLDDPHKLDNAFLPDSKKKWTWERYETKLNHLSEVIASAGKKPPAILSLVEIENRQVLEDLAGQKSLKKGRYAIVHREGPDRRGIDVAMLYNSKKFKLLDTRFYHVGMPEDKRFITREILYAKLLYKKTKDTLHIFVNHWPSRLGGQQKSEPKRMAAASVLRHATDSVFRTSPQPLILIMGDFNDEPVDKSISETLGAKAIGDSIYNDKLYNLALRLDNENKGTYYYWRTKEWNMLDQIIVSGKLFSQGPNKLYIRDRDENILKKDFFLYTNSEGVKSPAKTYGGSHYYGGYSDHLPVFIELWKSPKRK